jgi:hypothetical protein
MDELIIRLMVSDSYTINDMMNSLTCEEQIAINYKMDQILSNIDAIRCHISNMQVRVLSTPNDKCIVNSYNKCPKIPKTCQNIVNRIICQLISIDTNIGQPPIRYCSEVEEGEREDKKEEYERESSNSNSTIVVVGNDSIGTMSDIISVLQKLL